MDLELSPEQTELVAVANQLLDRHAPLSVARSYLDGQGDAHGLREAIQTAGWYGIGLEEDDPFGIPGLCLLAHAIGGHVAPLPLIDTVVGALIAGECTGGEGRVAQLALGQATAAVAMLEVDGDWSLEAVSMEPSKTPHGWSLDGAKLDVKHAESVDVLVAIGSAGNESCAFCADAGLASCIPEPAAIDPSTAGSVVQFDAAIIPDDAAAVGPEAAETLRRAFAIGAVATAAEGLGAASKALDLAVAYALERRQFGRPIGEFQAIQHLLADAHVQRELAMSTILYSAAALEERMEDSHEAASIAKAFTARASRGVMESALQVFGGVAFTWEHDAHLLQRRVLDCERRYGDASTHERALRELIVLGQSEARA
jgi:alkylation response protein AidB-like acyl-CoA dehydrogenase